MKYMLIIAAFIILLGMDLLFVQMLDVLAGEGMVLATGLTMLTMLIGGWFHQFRIAVIVLTVLGVLGFILWIIRRRPIQGKAYLVALTVLFLLSLVLYINDFVQRIDEFHQWAAAVKYMFEKNALPIYPDYIGDARQLIGTSLFYTYFQYFTGYHEAFMYVASTLLIWIGLLLPFSGAEGRERVKLSFFSVLMYVGIYSLYYYGMKNLYVDVHTGAWAGGIAGWWVTNRRKKTDIAVLPAALAILYFLKLYVGLLMIILIVALIAVQALCGRWFDQDTETQKKDALQTGEPVRNGKTKYWLPAGVGLFGVMAVFAISRTGSGFLSLLKMRAEASSGMTNTIISSLLTKTLGSPLSTSSAQKVTLPFLFVLCLVLLLTVGKKEFRLFGGYFILAGIFFMAALTAAYLFIFGIEESTKSAGLIRYLTIFAIYFFVITIVLLLREFTGDLSNKHTVFILAGLLLFFVQGINTGFIPQMTALNKQAVWACEDIQRTKRDIARIQEYLGPEERVYLINQDGENEFPTNTALYYLESQVNNYLFTPWKFTRTGSITRVLESETPSLNELPEILRAGAYKYVWVFASDKYLRENLGERVSTGEISRGLYRFVDDGAENWQLELVDLLDE